MRDDGCDHWPANSGPLAFGVCTFRRPALAWTLQSLAAQTLLPRTRCCVIVADNDDTPSARPLVEAASRAASLPMHHVHAPARNISVARNALLDRAHILGAEFLAIIDDDEIATPDWARVLLANIATTGADAVLGPVVAVYGPTAPGWMRRAKLHDTGPVIQRDGRIMTGYTGNVILRLSSPHVQGRRFDPGLGRSGGEDDVYFSGLVRDGGTIGFAPAAVVYEDVPPERERLWVLLSRHYRAGQVHGRLTASDRLMPRLMLFAQAGAKAAVLMAGAGIAAMLPARRTRALMRAALHLGVCSHLLGVRNLEIYGSSA